MEDFVCKKCKAKYSNRGSPCIWAAKNVRCQGAINIIGLPQQCENTGYFKEEIIRRNK